MPVPEKPFSCSECGKGCVSKIALRTHRSVFHREITSQTRRRVSEEEKLHKCLHCPWKTTDHNRLNCHIRAKHPEHSKVKSFCCDACERRCVSKSALNRHRSRYHKDATSQRLNTISEEGKRYQCPHCTWKGLVKKELNRHIKKKHTENAMLSTVERKERLDCSECSEKLCNQYELLSHYNEKHHYNLEKKIAFFKSTEAFKIWLKQLKDTRFVHDNCWKKAKSKVNFMLCDRSGSVKRMEGERRSRSKHLTKKIDFRCTSYLKAETDNETGSVTVEYCLDHIIHDIDFWRLGFSADIEDKIIEYLRAGLDTRWIIDTIVQMFSSKSTDDGLSVKYLRPEHVHNLRKKHQIYPGRINKHDMTSLEMRLEQDAQSGKWKNFFGYQKAEPSGENFQLGIMTQSQYELLVKHGHKGVAVDATHCTSMYDFRLMSLLVLDDRQTGVVVASFFCHSESEQNATAFFSAIKEKHGGVGFETAEFMSDDAPQYWSSWKKVMGDAASNTKHLLCAWHIRENWKTRIRTLKDKDVEDMTRNELNGLMREQEEGAFRDRMTRLLSNLTEAGQLPFVDYLQRNYLSDNRLPLWAPFCRQKAVFNVNMAIESFHSKLKRLYLKRREANRLDLAVQMLLKCVTDNVQQAHIMLVAGEVSYRMRMSHQRHRKGLTEYFDNGEKSDYFEQGEIPKQRPFIRQSTTGTNVWEVQSNFWSRGQYDMQFWTVQYLGPCTTCDMKMNSHCRNCGICYQEYICDCPSQMAGVPCKHMHVVAMKLLFEQGKTYEPTDGVVEHRNPSPPPQFYETEFLSVTGQERMPLHSDWNANISTRLDRLSILCREDVPANKRNKIEQLLSAIETLVGEKRASVSVRQDLKIGKAPIQSRRGPTKRKILNEERKAERMRQQKRAYFPTLMKSLHKRALAKNKKYCTCCFKMDCSCTL